MTMVSDKWSAKGGDGGDGGQGFLGTSGIREPLFLTNIDLFNYKIIWCLSGRRGMPILSCVQEKKNTKL